MSPYVLKCIGFAVGTGIVIIALSPWMRTRVQDRKTNKTKTEPTKYRGYLRG